MKRSPLAFLALIFGLTLASSLSSQAPSYTPFGTGCPGAMGVPVLAAAPGNLPCIGTTFQAEVTSIPFFTFGIGITGRSNTSWGVIPLPFDLTSVGMPGCLLLTDFFRTASLVISPGIGRWNLIIPSDSALIGQSFYQQAFVSDTTVPGLGAIMSNAAHGLIGGLADLVIVSGSLTTTPSTINAGGNVNVSSVSVRNIGIGPAGSFSTGYFLSTNTIITPADRLLLGLTVPGGLAPGATVSFGTRNVTIPVSTSPGNYFLGLLTDRHFTVPESNENNNTVFTALTVTPALPDLLIISGTPTLNPSTVEAGRTTIISTVRIRNSGDAPAGPFSIGYYISSNSIISNGDTLLASVTVTLNLSVGATLIVPSRTLTIPVSYPTGTKWIGVLVDRTNAVPELNEGNNTVARSITVTPALPDLFPLSMPTVTPNPLIRPFSGLPARFVLGSFQVRNIGIGPSAPFRIGFYFSTNSTISTSDTRIGTVNLGGLAAGATATIGSRALFTPGGTPGTYWIGLIVDDTFVIAESNNFNNTRSRQVYILN